MRGIALYSVSLLIMAFLDTSAKYATAYLPVLQVAWARYSLSVIIAIIVLRAWRHPEQYKTRRPGLQTLRAAFLFGATVLNFTALHYLQLAETAAISFAAPLIVTALAGPVLGEWPGIRRWMAVLVGFVGVLVIVQPGADTFQPAALWSVAAAFCFAAYNLTTRMLSLTENPAGMLVYGSLFGMVALTPIMPFVEPVWPPTWLVAMALLFTGIFSTIGHLLVIKAHALAPAAVLAPFQYTQILWMPLMGFIIFSDVPGAYTLVGAAIVIASGLYVLYRERVHRDR